MKNSIESNGNKAAGPITLVIHGGAGTIRKENMTPEKEKAYHDALNAALESGFSVLEQGGTSLDAVIAAIKIMEDSPLFNAGKGAVFTNEGKNELDASIMDGSNLMAGAVAGVTTIKNPITAAHAVMTKSEHVMLVGKGAELFAAQNGLEIVDPSYFFDSTRYQQLLKLRAKEVGKEASVKDAFEDPYIRDTKFGTVGAVALDKFGNIAAGTSTGGMNNKKYGRVGDAPIIGAGTYANNNTCAVSATGWGEFFIRLSVSHDISALMEYGGLSLADAADSVVMKKLPRLGGDGGVVALDRRGNFAMTFCSEGMYRGYITKKGAGKTFIYKE
ncbi:MAG TPA: isoaspartyl peptidase/L-asparaginase [Chryseosolibacter sp.]|nr:isoaspartyl peptidase/L-asparaginase [Chryseosolibacter sp.]